MEDGNGKTPLRVTTGTEIWDEILENLAGEIPHSPGKIYDFSFFIPRGASRVPQAHCYRSREVRETLW